LTRILALETSGLSGSAAALDTATSQTVYEPLPPNSRSAQSLAPAMDRALKAAGWKPRDVQVVAVTVGPGSFTGLRIGVTTAKTLAYAVGADVVSVNTLDVVARQAPREGTILWTALDAHRSQFYVHRYVRPADGAWRRDDPTAECLLLDVDAWTKSVADSVAHGNCASLASMVGIMVSGPVLEKPSLKFDPSPTLAPRDTWNPRADTVAMLAAELHAAGRRDDLWQLAPYYGRLAAAEEKRIAQGKE
jgi:tRNA threonylcarbamoyladenosine biosynthesis protein TsaB